MEIFLPRPHCSWLSLHPVNEQSLMLVKVEKPLSGAQTVEQTKVLQGRSMGKEERERRKEENSTEVILCVRIRQLKVP